MKKYIYWILREGILQCLSENFIYVSFVVSRVAYISWYFLQMFSFFILAQFDWGITKASRIREHYICQGRAETISCNGANQGKFCFKMAGRLVLKTLS